MAYLKRRAAWLCALLAGLGLATAAQASEGGSSVYLLGSGGPEAAVLPPLKGVYFANTAYFYDGEAQRERQFTIGGNVVAGLDATILANFGTVLWVPSTNVAGGVLAVGAALPVGQPDVTVSAVLTGPRGGQISLRRSEADTIVGDPLLTAALGWTRGKVAVQGAALLNVPIGDYHDGALANLAFHRWALDTSAAVSWRDPQSGWDLSAKAGFTFNGENEATNYDTGTEFHLEGSVEKTFSPAWSAGLQAYHFDQVTGDSGEGAVLGPFKGRVTAVGAHAAYHFKMGERPATLRLHALKEFNARNRLEGTSVFLDFSVPIHMVLPTGAGR